MFMLYGIGELLEIVILLKGKLVFSDKNLFLFFIFYVGNMVGVVLIIEGECGFDMELQCVMCGFYSLYVFDNYIFFSNELLWISK